MILFKSHFLPTCWNFTDKDWPALKVGFRKNWKNRNLLDQDMKREENFSIYRREMEDYQVRAKIVAKTVSTLCRLPICLKQGWYPIVSIQSPSACYYCKYQSMANAMSFLDVIFSNISLWMVLLRATTGFAY